MSDFDDEGNEITKVDSPDRPLRQLIPQDELEVPEPMLPVDAYLSYVIDMGHEIED